MSDALVAFPPEEVQAVADAGQIGADEEIGLARPQRGVEDFHIPLLHLHVLLVDEVHVVILDWRSALVVVRDELDLRAVRAPPGTHLPVRRRGGRGGGSPQGAGSRPVVNW